MPDGSRPTGIWAWGERVAGSIRDTVSSRLLATQIGPSPAAIGARAVAERDRVRHRARRWGRCGERCCRCRRRPRRPRPRPPTRQDRCRRRRGRSRASSGRRPSGRRRAACSSPTANRRPAPPRAGCPTGARSSLTWAGAPNPPPCRVGVHAHGLAAPAVGDPGRARSDGERVDLDVRRDRGDDAPLAHVDLRHCAVSDVGDPDGAVVGRERLRPDTHRHVRYDEAALGIDHGDGVREHGDVGARSGSAP